MTKYNTYLSKLLLLFIMIITPTAIPQIEQTDSLKKERYKEVAKQIVISALEERKGYELLGELCNIGPRLSGSENTLEAIDWAFNKMNELKLDSVWLQPVMVPHWERGDIEEATIVDSKNFDERNLEILALGGSIGTGKEGITAEVIEVKSFEELEERKDKVKGKIVFFSRKLEQGKVNTFSGYGGAVNQRVYGAVEAAKYGAVGVIVRSITTKYDNVPHTGSMSYVDTLPKIPSVTAGYLDSDFLHNALLEEPDLKINIKLNCKTLPDAKSYNVIGEIKGTELPNEVIVVGGHFDSWDVGCGAHDDGAGCIQALEVLDLLKRLEIKPKRTIRCVFFINEENGVRGGIEYGKFAELSNDIHVAAIESDRGAFTPLGFTVSTDSLETFNKIKSWLPILKHSNIGWIRKGYGGVDINRIKNTSALLGFYPDNQRYMDVHHSANDVFEEVHPREFELGAAAITIMAYLLSEEGL